MKLLGAMLILALAIPALWRVRWAYVLFAVLGLLYLPATIGFRLDPQRCDFEFGGSVIVHSLSNYSHIVLFAFFFLVTARQFRSPGWHALGWSVGLTMAMGAAIEITEGISGLHHCKAGDLVPDLIGALLGVAILLLARALLSRRNPDNGALRENRPVR